MYFITFEGIDGAGKSTQATMLKHYLTEKGIDCILIREPGSTMVGEKLRNIVLTDKTNIIDPITEVYIFAAARAQLVREVIRPNLANKTVVICDRFVHSSLVYQGVARGLSTEIVADINKIAVDGLQPDLTFFIDIPITTSVARKDPSELDRIEIEAESFKARIYDGYQTLTQTHGFVSINGTHPIHEIHQQVIQQLQPLLNL